MRLIARRPWRESVLDVGLERRLVAAGCPLSLAQIQATESLRNVSLAHWARTSVGEGVMLRSAQSERLSRGESLVEIGRATGITTEQVLYYLTRFEWEFSDETAVAEFYNQSRESEQP